MRGKGFTLIELIMVIIILGILAVMALPKYFDLQTKAKDAAEKGVVGAVRAGIATYFANQTANGCASSCYPASLDGAATGVCNDTADPCFDNVLEQEGISDGSWNKTGATTYVGPNGTTYTYTSANGTFR